MPMHNARGQKPRGVDAFLGNAAVTAVTTCEIDCRCLTAFQFFGRIMEHSSRRYQTA